MLVMMKPKDDKSGHNTAKSSAEQIVDVKIEQKDIGEIKLAKTHR